MRSASRTHWVASDWYLAGWTGIKKFKSILLNPKINLQHTNQRKFQARCFESSSIPEWLLVNSRWLDLSSSRWSSRSFHRIEERNIPFSTERGPLTQIWIWCKRRALTIIGTSMRFRVCQNLWEDSQNSFILLNGNVHGFLRSREERLRKSSHDSRPDNVCTEVWVKSRKIHTIEKVAWAKVKPKLDNVRRSTKIYLIDPKDEEYKQTSHNVRRKLEVYSRRKLEVPMDSAMFCWKGKAYVQLAAKLERGWQHPKRFQKTKYDCTVESHESTR